MLSMYRDIRETEIEDIEILRPGTVYKLTGHAGEVVVVKKEGGNANSTQLRQASKIMGAVSKVAGDLKPLSDQEKKELHKWADFMISCTRDYNENKLNDCQPVQVASEIKSIFMILHNGSMVDAGGQSALWYKMPYSALTPADKILEQRIGAGGAVDKSLTQALRKGLKDTGGLEQLGKIIAADMFLGNGDRFLPPGAEGAGSTVSNAKHHGTKDLKFVSLKNPGNLFLLGKNTQMKMSVSGHDYFDPNSQFRNFDSQLRDLEDVNMGGETWLGRSIANARSRRAFAKVVVQDLETLLSPNKRKGSLRTKLGTGAYRRVESGMRDGIGQIVAEYDKQASTGATMPGGMTERINIFRNS